MTLTSKTITALAAFDTPTICNAIELFKVRPCSQGYMDQRIKAHFPELPPMVGFCLPSAYRSAAPPDDVDVYEAIECQVEIFDALPGPAVMVFQDLDDPPAAANFGDFMCSIYQKFGGVGLITSGAGRDLEQVRAMRFPVFSSGAICAHGYCHSLFIGSPVRVGGLVVRQGDLVHGDLNGVTNIPLEIADELPEVAAQFSAAEKSVISFFQTSESLTLSQCRERRLEFQSTISELVKRVARTHT